ncbi:hypothetical protein [Aeromonas media]|uniref:hypothetical protein n=1 Tax=Aeromonas media TaxID=651 RepID=UPI003F688A84
MLLSDRHAWEYAVALPGSGNGLNDGAIVLNTSQGNQPLKHTKVIGTQRLWPGKLNLIAPTEPIHRIQLVSTALTRSDGSEQSWGQTVHMVVPGMGQFKARHVCLPLGVLRPT